MVRECADRLDILRVCLSTEPEDVMLTIRIVTIQGETVQLDVMQAEFVVTCPYCKLPFRTIDPDRRYCRPSHKTRAYELRVRGCDLPVTASPPKYTT